MVYRRGILGKLDVNHMGAIRICAGVVLETKLGGFYRETG